MPSPLEELGQRVATARRLLGLTKMTDINPTNLAEMMGVPPSTVTRIESGERTPSEELVEKLVKVFEPLGVTAAWIRYGIPSGGPKLSIPVTLNHGEKVELADETRGRKKGRGV